MQAQQNPASANEPKLDAPGAGLPLLQRVLLRGVVGPFVSKIVPLEESRRTYEELTAKIIALIEKTPADQRAIKVLVPPQMGLEDSSRYWSLNGLCEHLLLVSRGIEGAILLISQGQVPPIEANVAAMKPKQTAQEIFNEFKAYAPGLMSRIDSATSGGGMNIHSKTKFRHPWFGNLTARQWYWVLGTHQGIHYRQAKAIAKGLVSKA